MVGVGTARGEKVRRMLCLAGQRGRAGRGLGRFTVLGAETGAPGAAFASSADESLKLWHTMSGRGVAA